MLTMAHSPVVSTTLNNHMQLCESKGNRAAKRNLLLLTTVSLFFCASANPFTSTSTQSTRLSCWGKRTSLAHTTLSSRINYFPRGGAVDEEDEYDEEEYDDEYDAEEEEVEDVEEDDDETDGIQIELNVEKYDEPLVASPMTNLFATFGVMMLAQRVDLFSPAVVRISRAAFISYLILLQAFLLYVRVRAKSTNDRTPITLNNPLSSVLQSQLQPESGGNDMIKNLASSFLSSTSTFVEYDLKQARSMQSGLIINMLFMWFLHFKMEQVQPLIIQSFTGIVNLIFSPLFQIYVMGRNLERPFKNMAKKPEDMLDTATPEAAEEQLASVEVSAEKDTTAIEAIEDSSDEEEEAAENQESEEAEEEEEDEGEEDEDDEEEDDEEEDEEDDDE